MRVLVLSTLYPPNLLGGAEKSVALIAEGLAIRGHEVSVLTLHDGKASEDATQNGVDVMRRPLRNLYWPFPSDDARGTAAKLAFHTIDSANVAMARTVEQAVRQRRPEIVLSNQLSCFSALSFKAIHDAGAATLHSLRDFYLMCPKSTMFRGGKACAKQCADCLVFAYPRKAMSQYVDGVTGVSKYMIDRHRAAGLFRNALACDPVLSAVKTPASVTDRVAAAPEPVRHFGYIGRVEPEKGIDRLLDALLLVPPNQWRLSIAGRAPDGYLAHLRQRCDGFPVEFLGFIPDTQFYKAVDVVVVPSIWEEPLPRTVLEAFGYGLTVIASDRGGIPEVVRPGETGYLVDLERPEQMAGAVASAIATPMEGRAFGLNGRALVLRRTEAQVAIDYESASLQVLEHALRRKAS